MRHHSRVMFSCHVPVHEPSGRISGSTSFFELAIPPFDTSWQLRSVAGGNAERWAGKRGAIGWVVAGEGIVRRIGQHGPIGDIVIADYGLDKVKSKLEC